MSTASRATTALQVIIGVNVLVHLLRDDLRPYLSIRNTYSVGDGSLKAMLLSIVYHVDTSHLLVNMLSLYRYGSELFVSTSSKRWSDTTRVVLCYVLCGLGAFFGVEFLSRYHEAEWHRRVASARRAGRCTHWLCGAINDALGVDASSLITDLLADAKTSMMNSDSLLGMFHFQQIKRIGASGVVYGWMGMRLTTSWLSQYHRRMDALDFFFVVLSIAYDFRQSPLTLDDIRLSALMKSDGIDHQAHIMGALFGIMLAVILIQWDKLCDYLRFRRGAGRRLGSRWEDEQRIRQRENDRRRNSRLINENAGNSSSRRRERTML
mmetsp:Transcript_906/g.2113  ORF Transcript_906/g.2113 Transcript_906/m.2113 type:complete len:322 (+) Transcript_906:3142-4107(+)